MFDLKKIGPARYELLKTGKMNVPGLVIATDHLIDEIDFEKPLEQVCHVAQLPGIVGYSIAMPDIHWGYGFPIGGVAAMDAEHGVISPGGVGYDINCGVRLALVPIEFSSLSELKKNELLRACFEAIPAGVGHEKNGRGALTDQDYKKIAELGARWSIEQGDGFEEDLEHMESHGFIEGASLSPVSSIAKERGRKQLGTVGSGNHFVEIGAVDEIFSKEIAGFWDVQPGHMYILIHSGSRGFGHQICQDTLDLFVQKKFDFEIPDKQLISVPIRSQEGQDYFAAMAMAANFAFNNRQQILTSVRKAIHRILGTAPRKVRLLYDVCHNIAKFEEHEIEGVKRKLCVHRKGATRAFGKGAKELSPLFQSTGQPVLVPGDMGRSSHLLAGLGDAKTWCSCCHGAGRSRSRHQSMNVWKGKDLIGHMKKQGVLVMAASKRTVAEEMPDAYKDVDEVVRAVQEAGLAKMVARLRPALVVKG